MANASDKKPLLSTNSSKGSDEGSNHAPESSKRESSKNPYLKQSSSSAQPSTEQGPPTQKELSQKPARIVRPTAPARPFSTRTKGAYWVLTILHLMVLLAVLFTLSFGLLQWVFNQVQTAPLFYGHGSFIGGVPSVMFEPVKKGEKRLIKFHPNKNESYAGYIDRLKEVTKGTTDSESREDCSSSNRENVWFGNRTSYHCALPKSSHLPKDDFVCDPTRNPSMGYDTATPCILIRLTKILGFFPMDNQQEQTDQRPNAANSTCDAKVPIECTATSDNGDKIALLSGEGLPFCAFPFWNQPGYLPPYIMVRPEVPLPADKTKITCVPKLTTLKKLSNGRENKLEIVVDVQLGKDEKPIATLPPPTTTTISTTTTTTEATTTTTEATTTPSTTITPEPTTTQAETTQSTITTPAPATNDTDAVPAQ